MVTYPSTNRDWRRVTSSIKTNALPLSQATTSNDIYSQRSNGRRIFKLPHVPNYSFTARLLTRGSEEALHSIWTTVVITAQPVPHHHHHHHHHQNQRWTIGAGCRSGRVDVRWPVHDRQKETFIRYKPKTEIHLLQSLRFLMFIFDWNVVMWT